MQICLELLSKWWPHGEFGISGLRSYHNYCDSRWIGWKFSPSNSASEASCTENIPQSSDTPLSLRHGSSPLINVGNLLYPSAISGPVSVAVLCTHVLPKLSTSENFPSLLSTAPGSHWNGSWVQGQDKFCKLQTFQIGSMFSTVGLSIERYVAVVHPFVKYR